MFKKYLILVFVIVATSAKLIEIPDNLKNAKDIDEHPDRQSVLHEQFPDIYETSNKSGNTPFIIGGSVASRGQIPFQVLIYIVVSSYEVYMCGGSLISSNWVLTAAHCVYVSYDRLELYFGIADVDVGASWSTNIVKKNVYMHSSYSDSSLINDIALIYIATLPNYILDDPYVGLVPLPINQTSNLFVGSTGRASGFGRTSDLSQLTSRVLKYVDLDIITNAECESRYIEGSVRSTNICAATNATAGTCNGDSGGPLTIAIDGRPVIVGVVSFGASSGCQKGFPVGFTRITSYTSWINKTMTENSSPKSITISALFIAFTQIVLLIFKY